MSSDEQSDVNDRALPILTQHIGCCDHDTLFPRNAEHSPIVQDSREIWRDVDASSDLTEMGSRFPDVNICVAFPRESKRGAHPAHPICQDCLISRLTLPRCCKVSEDSVEDSHMNSKTICKYWGHVV